MTYDEIFKKALDKAVRGGYPIEKRNEIMKALDEFLSDASEEDITVALAQIYFSHDFAKAFWGNKKWGAMILLSKGEDEGITINQDEPEWKTHLQLMVISKDPILYLSKFI